MQYLSTALFAEGPTDHAFLRPVLRRSCEDVCARLAKHIVEIGDVLELHSPPASKSTSRAGRIAESAWQARHGWHVLFVHTDADNDPEGARAQRVTPAIEMVQARFEDDAHPCVGVVPINATEAWLLADVDAIQMVMGTTLTAQQLGIPDRPTLVEGLLKPRAVLRDAWSSVHRRHRRGLRMETIYEPLGERVSLVQLRQLSAYSRFEIDLEDALRGLRLLG